MAGAKDGAYDVQHSWSVDGTCLLAQPQGNGGPCH
jgi:hypothetical protein